MSVGGFDCRLELMVLLSVPDLLAIVHADKGCGFIGGDIYDLEPLSHFALHELRCALIPFVSVLVEDSAMMLLRALATFDHQ